MPILTELSDFYLRIIISENKFKTIGFICCLKKKKKVQWVISFLYTVFSD